MIQKNNLDEYLKTLIPKDLKIEHLIDNKKIKQNISQIKSKLEKLNFLLSVNSGDELFAKIKQLHSEQKDIFDVIRIFVALRENEEALLINDIRYSFNEIIQTPELIKLVFDKIGLTELILSKWITNFLTYAIGIEVGMDTNARKNRNGATKEEIVYEQLIKIFKKYDYIKIEKQKFIQEHKDKKFDFVITNLNSNKSLLVELSVYNAQGSKIQETAKSYLNIYKLLKENAKYKFIWLADGIGMKSIKNFLKTNFDEGYIYNIKLFLENVENLIINN